MEEKINFIKKKRGNNSQNLFMKQSVTKIIFLFEVNLRFMPGIILQHISFQMR
jgi:hypothetical protein